jgi:hypothetical protein
LASAVLSSSVSPLIEHAATLHDRQECRLDGASAAPGLLVAASGPIVSTSPSTV